MGNDVKREDVKRANVQTHHDYFDNVTFERLANEFAWGEAALRQLNEATQVAFATGSTRFQPPCKESENVAPDGAVDKRTGDTDLHRLRTQIFLSMLTYLPNIPGRRSSTFTKSRTSGSPHPVLLRRYMLTP